MTHLTAARNFLLRWRWYLCVAPTCTFLWMLYILSSRDQTSPRVIPRPHTFDHGNNTTADAALPNPLLPYLPVAGPAAAGNSTLGFEAILALSPSPSWRTRGLQAAANVTGLHIQIPPQPPIHPEIVDAFAGLGSEGATHPNRGSAAAWVAHLELIKHVIQSDLDTALIIEDDVDWDLSIREQMVGVAQAVRQLTKTPGSDIAPYGHSWDVLWIGACAESWEPELETAYIDDPTVIPSHLYVGNGKPAVDHLQKDLRVVFRSRMPICSFAYALSREGAKNVLQDIGAGKDEAFDIALMNGCRERNLTCISVLPELFRHYTPSQKMGSTSLVNPDGQDGNTMEIEIEMGQTENILESARCHALWGQPCLPPAPAPVPVPAPAPEPEPEPEAG
ncbi:hypothetical protein BJX76DRAFT_342658 [Aspergillus varians]